MPPAGQGQLRSARSLLRRRDRERLGRFLAEGRQAVGEALAVPGVVVELLVAADAQGRHGDLIALAAQQRLRVSAVPSAALAALSGTVTPQGLVAVCAARTPTVESVFASRPRLVVCCAQVRDPGNLGAVVRCADAFGADAVVSTKGSVDLYNPKVVRSTTGSLFHLPVALDADLREVVTLAHRAGLQVLGADASAAHSVDELAAGGVLAAPTMWVLGNEAWGLPDEDRALVDRVVRLPMYGRAESLNLATAAAVLLYATSTAQRAALAESRG